MKSVWRKIQAAYKHKILSFLDDWTGTSIPLKSLASRGDNHTRLIQSNLLELIDWNLSQPTSENMPIQGDRLVLMLTPLNEANLDKLSLELLKDFDKVLMVFSASEENVGLFDDVLNKFGFLPQVDLAFPLLNPQNYSGWRNTSVFHTEQFYSKLAALPQFDFSSRAYYARVSKWLGEVLNQRLNGGDFPNFFVSSEPSQLNLLQSLHEHWSQAHKWLFVKQLVARRTAKKKRPVANLSQNFAIHPAQAEAKNWRRILITGWYGTETAGDKAILGEVVHVLKRLNPEMEIVISTVNRHISTQTALEVEILNDIPLIDLYQVCPLNSANSFDAVIFGGGPIMDSGTLLEIREIFKQFNTCSKGRVIFGCGVGPLRNPDYRAAAADIIRLSTHGFYRDKDSAKLARDITGQDQFTYACDPALAYVLRWRRAQEALSPSNSILSLLRANTKEFVSGNLESSNSSFSKELALTLSRVTEIFEVQLSHMNATTHGGDDRLFNREVYQHLNLDSRNRVKLERKYLSLNEVLSGIHSSALVMAMRFHGHVFSLALAKPFVSIDYTGYPGKVNSLMESIHYKNYSVEWNKINEESLTDLISQVLDENEMIIDHLNREANRLEQLLHETYATSFGIESKISP